jgi:hypothetical protein
VWNAQNPVLEIAPAGSLISPMPRYFFHIRYSDTDLVLDNEGIEFEDVETAKHEAVQSIRDLVADRVKQGIKNHGLGIEVANEAGTVLFTVLARDILQ